MNKFQFQKFKNWFFNQHESHTKNENGELISIISPYYKIKPSNRCLRECGYNNSYQPDSWKYFTQYGNKNFSINNDYIEFDTPVDENGNTYNHIDACKMFYCHDIKIKKHCGNYKHIKINYKKFCYPLEKTFNNLLYWD